MRTYLLFTGLFLIGCLGSPAHAGLTSKAVRESAEWVLQKFVQKAAHETVETLSSKMARLAAQHGDEVVTAAFKKVGPRAGQIAAEAGEHGGVALKLLARHGDDAVALLARKGAIKTIARYGDSAATALIKHGTVGEKLVEHFGTEAVESLVKVTPQNGRRLAMMGADGTLNSNLLKVVSRFGDSAAEFIWKHKGALAVGATLTAFVNDPEPFLGGTTRLAEVVADSAIAPIASIPGTVASEAAKGIDWNLVVCLAAAVMSFLVIVRQVARRQSQGKEARDDGQ